MKAIICDVCGIAVKDVTKRSSENKTVFDTLGCKHSIDVCKNCWNDFKKFVELKKRT